MFSSHRRSWFVVIAVSSITQASLGQQGLTVLPLLTGGWHANAEAISLDGKWVVGSGSSALAGSSSFEEAFRWSAATGIQSLGPYQGTYRSLGRGVSADGSVVVGSIENGSIAFRWTQATGKQPIGPGLATAVSADGSVVVGDQGNETGFVWRAASGHLPVPWARIVSGVSADGQFAAGRTVGNLALAYHWQIGSEPHIIGSLPGTNSPTLAQSISPDGEIVAGWGDGANQYRAFVWTSQHGFVIIPAIANRPWCTPCAISADGRKVVGECTNGTLWTAAIWTGPGPSGPYTVHALQDYLAQRAVQAPANSIMYTTTGMTGDGMVFAGSIFNPGPNAYRAEVCYANCDDSIAPGMLTVADFTCFLQRFSEASSRSHQHQLYHYVNCDRSTIAPVLNVADFTCFLQKFAAGCP
jgi:uncharacterized membrane protein